MSSNIDPMAGRRRAEVPRDAVIHVRMRPDQKAAIQAMAMEDDMADGSWLYLRLDDLISREKRERKRQIARKASEQ